MDREVEPLDPVREPKQERALFMRHVKPEAIAIVEVMSIQSYVE